MNLSARQPSHSSAAAATSQPLKRAAMIGALELFHAIASSFQGGNFGNVFFPHGL